VTATSQENSGYSKPQRRKVVKRLRIASRGGATFNLILDCGHSAFRSGSARGEVVKIVECRRCPWVPA
jgi:hypothetical protein